MRGQKDVRALIAVRLKKARKNAGYASAENFCQQYGFNCARYQEHEEALHAMVASEIIRYCAALNISTYYLMLGEKDASDS